MEKIRANFFDSHGVKLCKKLLSRNFDKMQNIFKMLTESEFYLSSTEIQKEEMFVIIYDLFLKLKNSEIDKLSEKEIFDTFYKYIFKCNHIYICGLIIKDLTNNLQIFVNEYQSQTKSTNNIIGA